MFTKKKDYLLIAVSIVFFCFVLLSAYVLIWAQKFDQRIAPNVFIGSENMGGKTAKEAYAWLQKKTDMFMSQGVQVRLNDQTKTFPLSTLIGSDLVEYIAFDLNSTIEQAVQTNHKKNSLTNMASLLIGLLKPAVIPVQVRVYKETIKQTLPLIFPATGQLPTDTAFVFSFSPSQSDWNIEIKEGIAGNKINSELFLQMLSQNLSQLTFDPIELAIISVEPSISVDAARNQIQNVQTILKNSPFTLRYENQTGKETTWNLTASDLSLMLIPTTDGQVGLNPTALNTFIQPIIKSVNQPVEDARFKIINGRVTEFGESKNGIMIDEKKLFDDVLSSIHTPSAHSTISITANIIKSIVAVKDVNDLGITTKLGEGISNYKGSPANRKKNIQNGVRLLNGLLIAPGETFSLLNALKPFTKDNGYLPELVIKGNRIEPELGGGLCQIGTTTFRAVMNSGLPIIERQNHSLVVSYYNDPSNKNPGTDATIYEPSPDFKFLNDTGNYLLFVAENNKEKQQLTFSFWGTPDGRKGYYSPPVVSRWYPVGETQITETTNLKPEEKKCQDAHKGADASFTYTIEHADGTIEKKLFTSHYRSLPKICLVGVDPSVPTAISEQTIPATSLVPSDSPIPN